MSDPITERVAVVFDSTQRVERIFDLDARIGRLELWSIVVAAVAFVTLGFSLAQSSHMRQLEKQVQELQAKQATP
jgi:hypothetical protein